MGRIGRRIGTRRQRRVVTVLLVVLLALLTGIPALSSLWALRAANRLETQVDAFLSTNQRIQNLMVDQETGERGYILTSDPSYLQPYETGRATLAALWPTATTQATLVGGQAPALLAAVQRAASDWQGQSADLEIALVQAGQRQTAIADVESGGGKVRFDAFRARSNALIGYAESLRKSELAQATDRSVRLSQLLLVAGLLGVAALALLWYLNRLSRRNEVEAAREEELRFLTAASNALAASLDYDATMQTVANLAVPELADFCLVDIIDANGAVERVAHSHADPALEPTLDQLRDCVFGAPGGGPFSRVVNGDTLQVVADVPALLGARPIAAEYRAALAALRPQAALIAPLKARNRVLGALTLVTTTARGGFAAPDRALTEELANRCAVAIDNALLYRDAQQAIEARARERDRLEQLVDALPECVLIADSAGTFVVGNAAATALLGTAVAGQRMPMAGMEAFDGFGARRPDGTPYPAEELPLERAVLRGETVRGDQLILRSAQTGRDVPVLANSVPLRDASGAVTGGIVVFQDISALKDLDRQRDEFLSAVSHDLKNPLTIIKGTVQVQERRLGRAGRLERDQLAAALAAIGAATNQMLSLVEMLLDSTRLEMGRALDLHRLPTDLVRLARNASLQHGQLSDAHRVLVQSTQPTVIGAWDAARLERVLANLIGNAVKYSPAGGDVTVRVAVEQDTVGEWATLSVADQGLGIPAEDLPHIFERFRRSSNTRGRIAGAGIGLFGARQIVEQHGGTLTAASAEGPGSVFTVRLPMGLPDDE